MSASRERARALPLAVVGCDFRTAPSSRRSRLVIEGSDREAMARDLAASASVDGFIDLVTCNRVEWVVSCPEPTWAAEILRAQMMERLESPGGGDRPEPYAFVGEAAARHVFSVSIGQKSFVVGERQIASQLFAALEAARARGTSSRLLNGLGSVTGRLVRDAVREGCIGGPALGVHSLAFGFVKEWLGRHAAGGPQGTVAVVGMGAIGRLVRGLFEGDPGFRVVPVNRTIPAGDPGRVRPISELAEVLRRVDAAVVCTSAPHAIVRTATVGGRPAGRPLLVLDLGIPEQVGALDPGTGAVRAGLDDLTLDPDRAPSPEEQERHRAMAVSLVDRAVGEISDFADERSAVEILDEVRRRHDRFVGEEIPAFLSEKVPELDESRRAHVAFALKGMALEYTNDVFRIVKRAMHESGEDDWEDMA